MTKRMRWSGFLALTGLSSLWAVGALATAKPVDFDGDGISDPAVVRNTGGGPTGQITWYWRASTSGAAHAVPWGIATDFFIPEDYDNDGKTDVAIWRSGAPGSAAFYIFLSGTGTVRAENFGQSGDEPTVVRDYNNDGRADVAVYRAGAVSGAPSFWFWRTTQNGPVFAVQWGQNGDFPAPGDYDGDGNGDFVIQRNAGGGQARFWTRFATGSTTSTVFGTPTDVIVPGDYDNDGHTDIATVRGISGTIFWFVLPSTGGAYTQTPFGLSVSDFPTQGDFNGDGLTEPAVWRPDADPNLNFQFWKTPSSLGMLEWGQNGDYPVANFNTH